MRWVSPLLGLVALLACGGGESVTPTPVLARAASVRITPPGGPIEPGGSITLDAVVRDQSGALLAGKTLSWSSSNDNVATVSSGGVVSGIRTGTVSIGVTVDGKSDATTVTVANTPVAAVTIAPPTTATLAGQSIMLDARVNDAAGTLLLARRITWSSSAPLIASVDTTGRVTMLSPGTATITATCEGIAGTLVLTVGAPPGAIAPAIFSIAPAALKPATVATITGDHFVAGGVNTVMIAGVPAAVTSATSTELRVIVPAYGLPCQTTQDVAITVSTVGGLASLRHPLAVSATHALAVGERFVVGANDDIACIELPSAGSYLISVFNGSSTPTLTARFDLRGSAGDVAAAERIARANDATTSLDPVASAEHTARPTDLATEERAHERRLESDRALFERLGAPRRAKATALFSRSGLPPVSLTKGDTATMTFHYSSCGTAGSSPVSARVVYVGPKVEVLEDIDGALAGHVDGELIALAKEFETRSFPLLLAFGDPLAFDARTDANGRIIVLFTPKVNEQGRSLLGFVSGCDLYPPTQDPSVAASNQAEVLYARAVVDSSSANTTLDGIAQWRRQMPATMVHEAKHIVSYAERLSRGATVFEQVWLEEGTAQVASELYGRAIHGNGWRTDASYAPTLSCESTPSVSACDGGVIAMGNHFAFLTDYLQNFENKSILSGAEDNDIYGSSWLFARWLADSYGGQDEGAFFRSIVQTATLAGTANVEAATGKRFPQLLAEFTLMLATDELPNISAPLIEPSWNLPDVFAGYAAISTRPTTPLTMRTSSTGTFGVTNRGLRGGGAMLVRVAAAPGAPELLELRASATTPLSATSPIGMAVVRIE